MSLASRSGAWKLSNLSRMRFTFTFSRIQRIHVPPAHALSVPGGPLVRSSMSKPGIGPKCFSTLSPVRPLVPAWGRGFWLWKCKTLLTAPPAPAPRPQLSRSRTSSVACVLLPGLRASGCSAQLHLVESGKGSISAEQASVSSLSVSAAAWGGSRADAHRRCLQSKSTAGWWRRGSRTSLSHSSSCSSPSGWMVAPRILGTRSPSPTSRLRRRTSWDWTQTAGALTSSGIHPDTSTDTGRAQNCLSPEDTSDKWKGAAPCYSSVRMPVTQLEACIQAVLPCHHHLEAVPESSEFLQNVVYNHLEQAQ
ncbi:uncharacterized protein [Vicugna pacos]|uniref:Uncharacterized protein n=1 Tax=Vicugna pacos TaxID=30538 RepID=A0ABM5BWI8_VICPA